MWFTRPKHFKCWHLFSHVWQYTYKEKHIYTYNATNGLWCVCIHICTCVVRTYMYMHVFVCTHISMCVYTRVSYSHTCLHACKRVYYTYTYMHACARTHTRAMMYMCSCNTHTCMAIRGWATCDYLVYKRSRCVVLRKLHGLVVRSLEQHRLEWIPVSSLQVQGKVTD